MSWNADGPELVIHHLLYGTFEEPFVVYRVIRNGYPRRDDFRSAFDLQNPPPRRIQNASAPVWMSVSMCPTRDAAASRAIRFPKLGTHVAELGLRGGQGFAFAETVEPGHLSVWGDPLKLSNSVANVYPVSD